MRTSTCVKPVRTFLHTFRPSVRWYSVLHGRPGFTKEVFEASKRKVRKLKTRIFCNFVVDEIANRQQVVVYDGKCYYGRVDLGIHTVNNHIDNSRLAKTAFAFMAVALNGYWKVLLRYFFIALMSAKERAVVVETRLLLIRETGAILHFVTFDGTYRYKFRHVY